MSHGVHPVDERLPIVRLVPLAIQHVFVMYAGAVAVPLIIGRAVNLPPEQVSFLISADLFACGLATIVQSMGFPGVGIRLPVMMGSPSPRLVRCCPWQPRRGSVCLVSTAR
jgi:uric acid transporter